MTNDAEILDFALSGNLEALRTALAQHDGSPMDLAAAAALGDDKTVKALIDADPNGVTEPTGPRDWPPLLYTCFSCAHRLDAAHADGILETVKLLLDTGADPNASYVPPDRSPGGKHPALYGACGPGNNAALARLLLEAGADPNDDESLYHATEHRDHACLDALLDHGAAAGNLELHHMLDFDDLDGARKLLEKAKADPNITHIHTGETALHWAVNNGRSADTIMLLLKHSADVDAARNDGKTAYCVARRNGETAAAEVLKKAGAADTLSETDRFIAACAASDGDAARRMVADAPDRVAKLDPDDAGAIARLAFAGRTDAVALMLDLGFDAAIKTDGFTPLHNAAGKGDVATVALLLDHGAPLEVLNDYGGTVLDHTVYNSVHFANPDGDYPTVVERLIDAGASLAPITGPSGNPSVDAVLRKHGAFT
ncbi:MAG: ankyrin repeat domain-containing protein [Alphaproteobacteria bacterium]|nr:ankyrin repeat domain-containing protein [Alphaproteobacteria bacterium]